MGWGTHLALLWLGAQKEVASRWFVSLSPTPKSSCTVSRPDTTPNRTLSPRESLSESMPDSGLHCGELDQEDVISGSDHRADTWGYCPAVSDMAA